MLIDNFIAIYDDLLTPEQCQRFIDYFETSRQANLTFNRQEAENVASHQKNDTAMILTTTQSIASASLLAQEFTNEFWPKVYKPYEQKYSALKFVNQMGIITLKLQKTEPGQGYHVWHFEDDQIRNRGRILAFILYLNDVNDAGETEFLYLSKRIAPKAGRVLLWPAGFTHTHRGNPPLSETKYLLTGWIEWCN